MILHESRNARHALDLSEEVIPHLVLCDLALLSKGAAYFLTERKKRPYLSRTPVMVLGVPADRESILKSLMLGANDCVLKPISTTPLIERITHTLNKWVTPTMDFKANQFPFCTVTVPMEITRANETTLEVKVPISLGAEHTVMIDSPSIRELGTSSTVMRTSKDRAPIPLGGSYLHEVHLIGMDARTTGRFRNFLKDHFQDRGEV